MSRILHIAPGEPFGGVQRIVINLASEQAEAHEIGIVWTGDTQRADKLTDDDRIARYCAAGGIWARTSRVRKAIAAFAPDIVHLHMAPPWTALALAGCAVKTCYHVHSAPVRPAGLKARAAAMLDSALVDRAKVMIAISQWIEDAWRKKYPRARYRRVFNGIRPGGDPRPTRPIVPGSPPIIGFGSRLAADKGVAEFAQFALTLSESMPEARFRVAGDGPARKEFESTLSALVTDGRAELLGHVDDMPQFWKSLDLAIFSAPGEPFGLRLIEPVAEGVPVVAYETGAGSDEIARACAGIALVPYANAQAMARTAEELLGDAERRDAMARAGRKDIAEKFSIAAMARGLDAIYSAMLDGTFR